MTVSEKQETKKSCQSAPTVDPERYNGGLLIGRHETGSHFKMRSEVQRAVHNFFKKTQPQFAVEEEKVAEG